MSGEPSQQDRDLLSRLNALKKSTVDLDEKQLKWSPSQPTSLKIDADPFVGYTLHADITARFRALREKNSSVLSGPSNPQSGVRRDAQQTLSRTEDNDKTVEELLDELGPDEEWTVAKSEEDQVKDLLREAQDALRCSTSQLEERHVEEPDAEEEAGAGAKRSAKIVPELDDIDLSVFQPEPDSDPDDVHEQKLKPKSQPEVKQSLDREADEYLKRIMDEIRLEKPTQHDNSELPLEYHQEAQEEKTTATSNTATTTTPATSSSPRRAPSSRPSPQVSASTDSSLVVSSNLSSLSLPSVPTTNPTPAGASSSSNTASTTTITAYTDAEIDTWCIICNDDATLRCIGCDGDLYCQRCWMEGHQGWEERRHRAMVYNSDGGATATSSSNYWRDGVVKEELGKKKTTTKRQLVREELKNSNY